MSSQTKIAVYLELLRLVIDERGTLTRYHPPITKCLTGIFAYGFTPIGVIFLKSYWLILIVFRCNLTRSIFGQAMMGHHGLPKIWLWGLKHLFTVLGFTLRSSSATTVLLYKCEQLVGLWLQCSRCTVPDLVTIWELFWSRTCGSCDRTYLKWELEWRSFLYNSA